ncbi:structural maintenance of chromosomes smc4 [Culex quinquefasciatus]|uniref:Structural maintenance of chromosomes smc4 n=1 Tax=Culex quinquefasciatus TaxID=7176 RepID=B0XI19_CULQU|nr:structural maintenance of chromosomes smc4 [Culex quinquefasciatus]|eukprot:XP_001869291.1 structural maintenance of chromosomes smc4 [Culex quinquefasciatus]
MGQILDRGSGSFEGVPNTACPADNRKVNLMPKFLKQHGIDLDHNRFLMLQAEIESILLIKPKALAETDCGLLEYL